MGRVSRRQRGGARTRALASLHDGIRMSRVAERSHHHHPRTIHATHGAHLADRAVDVLARELQRVHQDRQVAVLRLLHDEARQRRLVGRRGGGKRQAAEKSISRERAHRAPSASGVTAAGRVAGRGRRRWRLVQFARARDGRRANCSTTVARSCCCHTRVSGAKRRAGNGNAPHRSPRRSCQSTCQGRP